MAARLAVADMSPQSALTAAAEPGRFQRRHRMLVMAGLLSALLLVPAWSASLAMIGLAAGYLAVMSVSAWQRLAATFAFLLLAVGVLWLGPPGPLPWWQGLAAMYFPLVISVLNLNHLWAVPGLVAGLLRGVTIVLLALLAAVCWPPALPLSLLAVIPLTPLALGLVLGLLEHLRRGWLARPARRQGTISVLLVCKDEIDRIDECLGRVAGWADEIVVLDSGSTDGTLERVRHYTDRVWETDWPGYGRQKQRALERCSGDWVLNIDADEYLSEELKREIDARLAEPGNVVAFRIPWVSRVFDGLVYFGADGRYHKRLFRREGARFNDADVHEDVVLSGRVATLGAPVCHDTFRDYAHMRAKFTDYSLISARAMHRRGRKASPGKAWLRGLGSFLLLYIRRMGCLDGRRGLLMATVYAAYTFDKYAALWSLSRQPANSSDER